MLVDVISAVLESFGSKLASSPPTKGRVVTEGMRFSGAGYMLQSSIWP